MFAVITVVVWLEMYVWPRQHYLLEQRQTICNVTGYELQFGSSSEGSYTLLYMDLQYHLNFGQDAIRGKHFMTR